MRFPEWGVKAGIPEVAFFATVNRVEKLGNIQVSNKKRKFRRADNVHRSYVLGCGAYSVGNDM